MARCCCALAAACLALGAALLPSSLAQPAPRQPAGDLDEAFGYGDKRAPAMGFQGMRGKKDMDLAGKRAPSSGFVGMRGKKLLLPEDLDLYEKRAPSAMGFQGMRGKKYDDGVFADDKRVGFVGMRGKKQPDEEQEDGGDEEMLELQEALLGRDDYYKRAPSAGFLGLRGKKAPSDSSFFGMRGKKDPRDLDELLYYLGAGLREPAPRQKRFPSSIKKKPSGFVGMRGKKYWADSSDAALLEDSEAEVKSAQ
ncbi:tachykinins [Bacillus rossius redtenbacheri]|uniref:tachykinins n=1 Tax=Bacillus rossius redtenbacheri TaxID=93214 RepID=UPI002FDDCCB7